jgi:ATP-dependent DNA helicase RecG
VTDDELREAFARESERVEWKESDRDTSALLQAMCALANDLENSRRSGFLVIGIRDDGSVVGTGVDGARADEATQSLVNRLTSSRMLPGPSISVRNLERDSLPVWVVQVEPYSVPPVVQVDGVAWVRKGTSTRRATEADLLRLRERRPEHSHPFDMRPIAGASIESLDTRVLRGEYEARRERDPQAETFPGFEDWLTQRELGRPVQGRWTPFAASVLLYGRNPQAFIPGAVVEMVRYGGADVDGPVVWRRTVTGALPDQLDTLWAQVSAHVAEVPSVPNGIVAPYVPEYPLDALKELARNLVQHRLYEGTNAPGRVEWFDDRIVFSNPGGPFGRASEGEFGSHADYRNPAVTRGLVDLGYVERLGRGIRLVRAALQRNGNPAIEVEVDGFTSVVVRRRPA